MSQSETKGHHATFDIVCFLYLTDEEHEGWVGQRPEKRKHNRIHWGLKLHLILSQGQRSRVEHWHIPGAVVSFVASETQRTTVCV